MTTAPSTDAPGAAGTFADIWQRAVVDDAAALLTANGVAAGDALHLCLRNSPAFIALWLATAKLGAWMVPVDPASSSRDVETQLGRVHPKIGFYAAARAETYLAGVAEGSTLQTRRRPRTSRRVVDCTPATSLPRLRRPSIRTPASPSCSPPARRRSPRASC